MKLNIKYIFLFSALTLAFSSCERNFVELPADAANDPVFRLEMNIDNVSTQIVAGEESYYNHTSYDLDQNEVYTFSGMLANENCTELCANAYRFNFRNYETGTGSIDVDQSLTAKSYIYKYDQAPVQDAIELYMDINTQAQDPSFTWEINDEILTQADVSDILVVNVPEDERMFAAMTVFDRATGLSTFTKQQIHLDESIVGVSSSIKVTQIEGDSVEIEIVYSESEFNPLTETLWVVKDLAGGVSSFPDGALKKFRLRIGEGKNINNYTAFFLGLDGTETSVGVDIKYDVANDEVIYHDADYSYILEKRIAEGSNLNLQSFEFELFDENGVQYSSSKGEQNADSFFKIIDIEPFIENAAGHATMKITCEFSCKVFSDSGEVKIINNASSVIAVAIP